MALHHSFMLSSSTSTPTSIPTPPPCHTSLETSSHFPSAVPNKLFCYCSCRYDVGGAGSSTACCRLKQKFQRPSFLQLTQLSENSGHYKLAYNAAASSSYPAPEESDLPRPGPSVSSEDTLIEESAQKPFWKLWQSNTTELRIKLAKLGLAAILAYGIIDGITYTTFFVLAFCGYEKSTGKNPAANLQALLGVVILMWTGNNITRPFRVAGAAALAPYIDKVLRKIQKSLKLPSLLVAFMLVVASIASLCFTIVGLLILSKWGKFEMNMPTKVSACGLV